MFWELLLHSLAAREQSHIWLLSPHDFWITSAQYRNTHRANDIFVVWNVRHAEKQFEWVAMTDYYGRLLYFVELTNQNGRDTWRCAVLVYNDSFALHDFKFHIFCNNLLVTYCTNQCKTPICDNFGLYFVIRPLKVFRICLFYQESAIFCWCNEV